MTGRPSLEEARARLRELGYLDAGVERLLFRPVFEGRGGAFLPAVAVGSFAAALAAVAAVESSEEGLGGGVAGPAALFVHVFVADLLPAALLAMLLGWLADRSRTPGVSATLAGLSAGVLVFALWIFGTYGLGRELPVGTLLWAIPVGAAALLLAAAVRLAFLARAFARSGALPGRAARRAFGVVAAAAFSAAALLFFTRRPAAPAPPPQPSPRSAPTVVLAIDGLDLDGPGRPARIAEALERGAAGWWPAEKLSPPAIWTTLAAGVSPRRHGVRALARVRPLGSPVALRPPFGTSWYLRRIGPALHTVVNAPVSGADRRSPDFWEVSASAGIPSLAVGWWASSPWPGAEVVENRAIFARARDGVGVDRIAIQMFEAAASRGFGLSTVYLPGADIARDDPPRRAAALSTIEGLLERDVRRARAGEIVLIVLAADSHPGAPGALGRMVVFDGPAAPRTLGMRPADAAPSILARTGVPAAEDLEGRPVVALFAPGAVEAATVPTYGARAVPPTGAPPASDREYLEKLRSLGYLK